MTESRWSSYSRRLSMTQEYLLVFALTSGPALLSAVLLHRGQKTGLFTATTTIFIASLCVQAVTAAILVPVLRARGWRTGLNRALPALGDVPPALGLWLSGLLAVLVVHLAVRALHGGQSPAPFKMSITAIPIAALAMAMLDPLYEEILWLGYWFRRIEGRSIALALGVSVGLRTLAHGYQGGTALLTMLPIGLVWTLYFRWTRRLWPIILAHITQDVVATILLLTRTH